MQKFLPSLICILFLMGCGSWFDPCVDHTRSECLDTRTCMWTIRDCITDKCQELTKPDCVGKCYWVENQNGCYNERIFTMNMFPCTEQELKEDNPERYDNPNWKENACSEGENLRIIYYPEESEIECTVKCFKE